MKKLAITNNKGFHMTFENGLTASVQWGRGNYCENHFNTELDFIGTKPASSNNAEVAVFDKNGDFLNVNQFLPECVFTDGEVCGHLSPDGIVDFLAKVKDVRFNQFVTDL